MLQLQLQRFVLGNGHRFAHNLFAAEFTDDGAVLGVQKLLPQAGLLRAVRRDPVNVALLFLVIQRHIAGGFPATEHADLSHALRAHTTDRQICHASVFKLQPRIGDILARAQDRHANAIDLFHRRIHKRQHDIQIMNHQIQHHTDIHAARRIRREPVSFNKARFLGHGLQVIKDRIEALHMTNLQHAIVFLRQLHQLSRLIGLVRDRFLHQHMTAGLEKFTGQFMMRHRRCHNTHAIGLFQRGFHGFQRANAILFGNLPGPFEIGIVQPHELHIAHLLHLGINPGMMLAQAPDAQHGHFHNIRHAGKGRHSGRLVQG